jgi:hypothetical protein
MEYIKSSTYSDSYPAYTPSPTPPDWNSYGVNIQTAPVAGNPDVNIQKVTVTITYQNINTGKMTTTVLEDYKVN